MNDSENNFESLRRLLALKRHEAPPPCYFENFSREVTARLRVGEASRTAGVSSQLSWLSRLLSAFEAEPAWAGGFASVLCLLLLLGIVYAERPEVESQPLWQPAQATSPLAVATPVAYAPLPVEQSEQPAFVSSTNLGFNLGPEAPWLNAQPAMARQVSLRLLGN
jgi:hypothetical protein